MNPNSHIASRAYMVSVGLVLLAMAIVVKVFMLQAMPDPKALEIAKNFTYKINEIEPVRGQIISTDGSLLATSVPEYEIRWDSKANYDIELYRAKVDSMCLVLSRIAGDKSSAGYREQFSKARSQGLRYQLITDHIDYNKLQKIKQAPFIREGRYKSGFIFIEKSKRKKPLGALAARTIGLEREDHKVGLELAYDQFLAGKKGKQMQERIPGGVWKPMSDEYIVEPEPGYDLVATIDVHLQDVAHSALRRQLEQHRAAWGCAILMEVETGYVRASANLMRNAETGEYEELLNLAISQNTEPGSTMKLASLMACLEEGSVDLEDSVATGNGIAYFYGKPMKDSNWDEGGNGTITLEQTFEKSSNIGTALLVKQVFENKPQRFLDKLQEFGISSSLGVELSGETKPRLYATTNDPGWSGLSLTQLAIGYESQCTPLQTLAFYNAVANDGKMVRPLFAEELRRNGRTEKRFKPVVIREDFCSSSTIRKCRQMMEGVMDPGGTADWVFKNSPYRVAGKTGTCWLNEGGSYQANRYRASFVGYFPADEPKYSCIVVVHDPRSGSYYGSAVAAPVFKELADKIYSTKIEFHEQESTPDSTALAAARIPVSKNGSGRHLQTVYRALDIPVQGSTRSEWVTTESTRDSVQVLERAIKPGMVPNVVGMGLRDAMYLLESCGLQVRANGTGTVRRQSIPPGTRANTYSAITIELL
ncbi:MAG: penicillin-binding protein [Flavobacteriales bacterium]|jgi:cell division protein FtsI (penicillin-binding protein 3)